MKNTRNIILVIFSFAIIGLGGLYFYSPNKEELNKGNLNKQTEVDVTKHSPKVLRIPDFYKNLKVLKTNNFSVEISREEKDCEGIVKQKCLQVKKEGGEWELFYDKIYGFKHKEGDYYILKVEERVYDIDNDNFPADVSDRIWILLAVEKIVPQKKNNFESRDKDIRSKFKNIIPFRDLDGNLCESCGMNIVTEIDFLSESSARVKFEDGHSCMSVLLEWDSDKYKTSNIKHDDCFNNIKE